MAVLPPLVHTYHCICNSLLLASTHSLSKLPRRAAPSLDNAYILPVPSEPPSFAPSRSISPDPQEPQSEFNSEQDDGDLMEGVSSAQQIKDMPAEGFSLVLGMQQDKKVVIIRREDGFEKRFLWRCMRCKLVAGYEITGLDGISGGGEEKGKGGEYEGKVVYLLPNGILGTDVMVQGKKIGEDDVDLGDGRGVGVWE